MADRGVTRRRMLALGGAGAAGAVGAACGTTGTSPAGAAGTDRGMTTTVVARDAGAPFQKNGDAQCDGTGDDVEIQAAVDSLADAGGGTVELSRGTFHTASPIVLRSNVTLVGQGGSHLAQFGTRIRRAGNHTMITADGTGPGGGDTHAHGIRIRDLELDGAELDAIGLQVHYADSMAVESVCFSSCSGHAIEAVEWWDSDIWNCRFDYCGSRDGSGVPAVGIYGERPDVPSDQGSNNLRFRSCTWETFADAALVLQGAGGGGDMVGYCSFRDVKIESVEVNGTPVMIDTTLGVVFSNALVSMGALSGTDEPQDMIVLKNSYDAVFEAVHAVAQNWSGESVRSFFSIQGGNHHLSLGPLFFTAGTTNAPTVAAIEFTGTNEQVDLGYHGYGYDGTDSAVLRAGDTTKKFRSSGTVELDADATSATVTHDLWKEPRAADISVTPTADLGDASKFWLSDVTASTFRVNVDRAPGASTSFAWRAEAT